MRGHGSAARRAPVLAAMVVLALGAPSTVPAAREQAPEVAGAEVRSVAAGDDLAATIADLLTTDARWIGWRVPLLPKQRVCRGGHGDCSDVCALGGRRGLDLRRDDAAAPARRDLLVILEVDGERIRGLRPYGEDCRLAAAGDAVAWLDGVGPAASVAWLETVARGGSPAAAGRGVAEEAVGILALHDGAEALASLTSLARRAAVEVRESAIFWLGSARGRPGHAVVAEIVGSDPSVRIRERAVFALHVSEDPRRTDRLIEVAHDDDSPEVRRRAVFWLAQQAGRVAAGAVEDAVEHDPDRAVRLQAVFGLSQLPPDEGVPLLIGVARSHGDPEVRRKALFWLGQTDDDRALAFIEELLRGRAGG